MTEYGLQVSVRGIEDPRELTVNVVEDDAVTHVDVMDERGDAVCRLTFTRRR